MVTTSLSLHIPVPCTIGYYGEKLVTFQTQVKPTDLLALLGHDPRSKTWPRLPDELREMYQYLQRKTSKDRKLGTKRYIETRFSNKARSLGAFPALAIGALKPAKFVPYSEKYPAIGLPEGVGTLELDLSASNPRVLLDGLSRVTGALDLIDEGQVEIMDSFVFPVTIFAPTEKMGEVTVQELGQLFHDFNFLAVPIPTGQAIDLDQTNIYIQMTTYLGRTAVIKQNGGMEARAKSLGKKSTALVAKQVLLRFVKGATEGEEFLHTLRDVPNDDGSANLTDATFDSVATRLEKFIENFASAMGERFKDRTSLHLTAPGWNALGVVAHDILFRLNDHLSEQIAADIIYRIGSIDWSRYNKDWFDPTAPNYVDFGQQDKDEKGIPYLGKAHGGQQAISKLIAYVRKKSGLAAYLDTLEEQSVAVAA